MKLYFPPKHFKERNEVKVKSRGGKKRAFLVEIGISWLRKLSESDMEADFSLKLERRILSEHKEGHIIH